MPNRLLSNKKKIYVRVSRHKDKKKMADLVVLVAPLLVKAQKLRSCVEEKSLK